MFDSLSNAVSNLASIKSAQLTGKFNDIITVYDSLTDEVVSRIADKFLGQLEARLKEQNIELEVTPMAKAKIVEQGSDITYGARPLKRYIQQNIETKVAYMMIEQNVLPGTAITVDWENDDFTVRESSGFRAFIA